MKKLFFYFGLMVIFFVSVSFAQQKVNLVELAKKEKERRAKTKTVKVFTNQDIAEFKAKNPQPEGEAQPTQTAETTSQPEATQTPETAQPDRATDEQYWRNRYKEAVERVEQAEKKLNDLQSDVNALTRAFYAEGDGVAQRGVIERERNQRLADIEKGKQELAEAKQALTDLEDEARRAGAMPGWVR